MKQRKKSRLFDYSAKKNAFHTSTFTVVRGEAVDNVHVLPERVLVLLRDESRTDAAARGADALDVTARQEEVMRRRLARHRQPALLRRPDHRDLQ